MVGLLTVAVGIVILAVLALGVKTVNQTERGIIERFGKFNRYAEPGFHYLIPFIEVLKTVNVTEQMTEAPSQEIITKDKLNAKVAALIFFKVKPDEQSVKDSQYNVYDVEEQIVALGKTTLRNIIGGLLWTEANSQRDKINGDLVENLRTETKKWGVEIVRAELKEIDAPADVQETMNRVSKAENLKQAAIDEAIAVKTKASGEKEAKIQEAEGVKQSKILLAEGDAKQIELVNNAANKYFDGNAKELKKLQVAEVALANGTKIIIDSKTNISQIISDVAGLVPVKEKK